MGVRKQARTDTETHKGKDGKEGCAGGGQMMIAEQVKTILLEREQIAARVAEIGDQITRDYCGREPILAPAMRGALIFFADLIRHVRLDLRCDLIWVSSYGDDEVSTGRVELLLPPREDWAGQDILFIEDIVDTGRTAEFLFSVAKERRVRSAKLCTLLDKPSRRICPIEPDYVGFTIPNEFVVGYGLDRAGLGRNLEFVGTLE